MLDEFSNHFIIQLPYKYIWYSQSGREQLFNLEDDSGENKDLSKDEKYKHILANLRSILIDELKDREEGFVRDNNLVVGVDLKAILAINENYKEI